MYTGSSAGSQLWTLWTVLVVLVLVAASEHEQCSIDGDGRSRSACSASPETSEAMSQPKWIVRFKEYRLATEHHSILSQTLPGEGVIWSWVPRNNKAATLPTDFGLVSMSLDNHATVASQLAAMPSVRDMHMDKRFTGSLKWVPEGPLKAVFDVRSLKAHPQGSMQPHAGDMHVEEGAAEDGSETDFSVWKRPGRMSTPFPVIRDIELEESEDTALAEEQQEQWQEDAGGRGHTHGTHAQQQQQRQRGEEGELHRGHDRSLLGAGPKPLVGLSDNPAAGSSSPGKGLRGGLPIWSKTKGGQRSVRQGRRTSQQPSSQAGSSSREKGKKAVAMKAGTGSRTEHPSHLDIDDVGVATSLHRGPVRGVAPLLNLTAENTRRRLLGSRTITSMLDADQIWKQGASGKGVKVGVFDTGIREDHPHMRNIKERTNWTHQNSLSDGLGHGTFVAGVIGSQDSSCPGFAPDVELYTFKVFTDDQVSFTSWFLDAFNYALIAKVHVINLSIGGPDFLDQPFVDKVLEITSNGVLMISAIGNDGPLYGTLNNPADQMDVIGVGGIDDHNNIASFSSRGMTTWELTTGSGRVKPDIMAYSKDVTGSKIQGGCRTLSGTSVASPVVAGAVCLLASTVPESVRWSVLNPASMKQALVEGADRLSSLNIYEQGAGRVNLAASMKILQGYQPRASVIPSKIDLTDCPYMWPYCRQGLYAGALPVIINATVLNAMGVAGWLEGPPVYRASDVGGKLLHIQFSYSETFWPWSGFLGLYLRVRPHGDKYSGTASGTVEFTVVSPAAPGENALRKSTVVLPVRVRIQPPPPRHKRILWDQFHSIKYPPGYMPRDNLDIKHDILDWHGDHLYTNYHGLFNFLRDKDYYVEVLSSPATCFDATQYGALLIVDSEDEFYKEEISKLAADVSEQGLSIIVFAEWYHVDSMLAMKFFDDNTRSWWTPATGGANIPALNDMLEPYGVAFGDSVLQGSLSVGGQKVTVSYGADVAKMPPNSFLHKGTINSMAGKATPGMHGLLGVAPIGSKGGHVAVFGDSNCLDSSHQSSACYEFLARVVERVTQGTQNGIADAASNVGPGGYVKPGNVPVPKRRTDINFTDYSWVLKHPLQCYLSGGCQYQKDVPTPSPSPFTTCGDFLQNGAQSPTAARTPQASTTVSITYPPTRTLSARARADGAASVQQQQPAAGTNSLTQPQVSTITGASAQGTPGGHSQAQAGTVTGGTSTQQAEQAGTAKGSTFDLVKLVADVSPFKLGLGPVHVVMIICVVGVVTVYAIYTAGRRGPRRFPRPA